MYDHSKHPQGVSVYCRFDMQPLTEEDIVYFNDVESWQSGPSFHAVFLQRQDLSLGKFVKALVSDDFVLRWNHMPTPAPHVTRCIISDPDLTHPIGAKIFEKKYANFLLAYISIPTHHVERICGQDWVYGRYDLDQMVALHNVIIRIAFRTCFDLTFSTIVMADEAWAWPTTTDDLPRGVLVNHQIALHAGWGIESVTATGYALISFAQWE